MVEFHDRLTVLVGDNGSGKSSLLEAIAIAAGAFLQGLGVGSGSISKDDVRSKRCDMGTGTNLEPQYPISISEDGEVAGLSIHWQRELNSPNGRTSSAQAKQMLAISADCLPGVRDGSVPDPAYPLVLRNRPPVGAQTREADKQATGDILPLGELRRLPDDMPNEKRMLKWFDKMTIQEMQSDKPCPEFAAVKEAITRFYAAMTGASTVNVQFNLAAT